MGDLGSGGEECFSSEETFQLGLEDEQEFPRDKGQGHSGRVNRAYRATVRRSPTVRLGNWRWFSLAEARGPGGEAGRTDAAQVSAVDSPPWPVGTRVG